MKDGVHVPALVIRVLVIAALVGVAMAIRAQVPEIRRYLKLESM